MIGNLGTSNRTRFALIALAVLIGACTSAEELLDDGRKLETKGSYEEAAWKYIGALRKDEDLEEARERLQWVGDTLVAMHLDRAVRSAALNHPIETAEAYLDIDHLDSGALSVGVEIWLPEDYAPRRRDALDAAIGALEDMARAARFEGRFGQANDLLSDATDRFDPEPPTREHLLISRFDDLLAWAQDLSGRGRYRESVRRTDEALAIAETIALDPTTALALRNAALEAGTVYVAATPILRSRRQARDVSPAFLADLNDRLELDYWSTPPEFIAFAHPALVRRRLRQLDLDRGSLSRRDARLIARDLDANFAVIAEIDRYEILEKDVREREKAARTRSGKDTVYYLIQGRAEIRARISYTIIDARGDVVKEGDVEDNRGSDFKRARYDGDYRDLDISGGDRHLFDGDRYDESVEHAEEELAKRLAERFGRLVVNEVLNRVR